MSKLRFGIIGCGVIGGMQARVLTSYRPLAERARLVAVASSSVTQARRLAAESRCEAMDVDTLLRRRDIDAVSVCTPSGRHASLGTKAFAFGKHVVVEKPIDVTVQAAEQLIESGRRAGRQLAVISQYRFAPAARVVHRAVRAGELGRLTSGLVELPLWRGESYYAARHWRGSLELDGGGALLNQGVHALDLIQWLMGPIVEVAGHTALLAHRGIEVEDVVTASLRHKGGALTSLLATTAAYPGRTVRVAVHGDRGSAVLDNDELGYFHAAADGRVELSYGAYGLGNEAARRRPPWTADGRDSCGLLIAPHGDQLLDFCEAVAADRSPAVDGACGLRTLRAALAVYESARTGCAVPVNHQ